LHRALQIATAGVSQGRSPFSFDLHQGNNMEGFFVMVALLGAAWLMLRGL
jgi:hypothetical protein